MSVRPVVGNGQSLICECISQILGVLHDAMLQVPELIPLRELQGNGDGSELVHVRPPLLAGEDRRIDLGCDLRIGCQDDRTARAAQGLVGSERYDIRDPDRVWIDPADDQAGRVGDVRQKDSINLISYLAVFLPIGLPGI